MSPCAHEQFKVRATIANPRDGDAGFSATISIRCVLCGMPMQFVGVSPEPSTDRPMVAHGDTELRIPLRPQGEKKEEKIQ